MRPKERAIEIYGGKCANFEKCQSLERPTIHHIIFKSDAKCVDVNNGVLKNYPVEELGNLVPLCYCCHTGLHRKIKILEKRTKEEVSRELDDEMKIEENGGGNNHNNS